MERVSKESKLSKENWVTPNFLPFWHELVNNCNKSFKKAQPGRIWDANVLKLYLTEDMHLVDIISQSVLDVEFNSLNF